MRKAKEDLDRRGEEQRGESTKSRRCEEQKKKRQDWNNQLKGMPTDTRSLKRQGVESLLKPLKGRGLASSFMFNTWPAELWKNRFLLFLSDHICGNLLQQPWEMYILLKDTTHPLLIHITLPLPFSCFVLHHNTNHIPKYHLYDSFILLIFSQVRM